MLLINIFHYTYMFLVVLLVYSIYYYVYLSNVEQLKVLACERDSKEFLEIINNKDASVENI